MSASSEYWLEGVAYSLLLVLTKNNCQSTELKDPLNLSVIQ